MVWLLAIAGCGCNPSQDDDGSPPAPEDSAPQQETAHTADTGLATVEVTGTTGSTGATALTGDTGVSVPGFDTAGPVCAGSSYTDTGIIQDTAAPLVDCDLSGAISVAPGPSVRSVDLMLARVIGDVEFASCGWAMLGLGDTDGDGDGEFAVGCPLSPSGNNRGGEVWIFDGSSTGDLLRSDATTVLTPGSVSWWAYGDGENLEIGDLTGDGAPDLLVADNNYQGAYVLPLPLPPGEFPLDDYAAATIDIETYHDAGAYSIRDFDGDGIMDLGIAGQQPPNQYPLTFPYYGGLGVLRGPLSGALTPLVDNDATFSVGALDATWWVESGSGQYSGKYTRALIHDVDGDGTADVLIGGDRFANYAPPESVPSQTQFDHGGVALFTGGQLQDHRAADATAVLYGTCYGDLTGESQSTVGDVTGDCRPDVATSAYHLTVDGTERGGVFVLSELHRVRGPTTATRAAGAIIVGEDGGDLLGDVGYLGDLNQDGYDDLVVGARFARTNGAAYIFLGPISGLIHAADADLIIEGAGQDAFFGSRLRWGRDIDGDGVSDLLVGAYGSEWHGLDNEGAVYVFSGADMLAEMGP